MLRSWTYVHGHVRILHRHQLQVNHRRLSNRRSSGQGEFLFVLARIALRFGGRLFGNRVKRAVETGDGGVVVKGVAGLMLAGGASYLAFSETVPYSHRRHIVHMSTAEEMELSNESLQQVLAQERANLLPDDNEDVKLVGEVTANIVRVCRSDGVVPPHLKFTVHVVKSPIKNAFVLPNGHIFVYTGILPIAETEAGLAAIIGHEITHALARHSAEKISKFKLLILYYEFLRGFGEGWEKRSFRDVLFEFVAVTVLQIALPLAHSRRMEQEADRVGTLLVAKAGYDPRHVVGIWQRMIAFEESLNGDRPKNAVRAAGQAALMADSLSVKTRLKELMATHPSHERRVQDLQKYSEELMPEYESAVRRMELEGLKIPDSDRPILPSMRGGRTGNIDGDGDRAGPDGFVFKDEDVYDYDENSLMSAAIASKCSALMVGRSYEDDIWAMVKDVGWK